MTKYAKPVSKNIGKRDNVTSVAMISELSHNDLENKLFSYSVMRCMLFSDE